MQMMPIMFSVLFIFFPSGLVLYWFVQNILSIVQQWHDQPDAGGRSAGEGRGAATRRRRRARPIAARRDAARARGGIGDRAPCRAPRRAGIDRGRGAI